MAVCYGDYPRYSFGAASAAPENHYPDTPGGGQGSLTLWTIIYTAPQSFGLAWKIGSYNMAFCLDPCYSVCLVCLVCISSDTCFLLVKVLYIFFYFWVFVLAKIWNLVFSDCVWFNCSVLLLGFCGWISFQLLWTGAAWWCSPHNVSHSQVWCIWSCKAIASIMGVVRPRNGFDLLINNFAFMILNNFYIKCDVDIINHESEK